MLMSNTVWAAYGIRTAPPVESFEMQSLTHLNEREPAPQPSLAIDSSSTPTPTSTPSPPPNNPTTTFSPAVPAAPYASAPLSTRFPLSPAAIAGLCIGVAVLVVCAVYIVLEVVVLRGMRREKAFRRAVEEVENGSIRCDSVRSEVKSREGWVVCEKEVGCEEDEGGRKGMSLTRRMW